MNSGYVSGEELKQFSGTLTNLTFRLIHKINIKSTEQRLAIQEVIQDAKGAIVYSDFSRARSYVGFRNGELRVKVTRFDKALRYLVLVLGPILFATSTLVLIAFSRTFSNVDTVSWPSLFIAISGIFGAIILVDTASRMSIAIRLSRMLGDISCNDV